MGKPLKRIDSQGTTRHHRGTKEHSGGIGAYLQNQSSGTLSTQIGAILIELSPRKGPANFGSAG